MPSISNYSDVDSGGYDEAKDNSITDPFTDEEGVEPKVKVVGETCTNCEG